MKWLSDYKMRLVLAGSMAAIVLGSRTVEADFTFGEPTALDAPINSGKSTPLECMSADGLELYMSTTPSGGSGGMSWDLIVSTRPTTNDPWSVPVNLGPPVNTDGYEAYACLSNDGLELYFTSRRSGGYGRQDIWVTTRESMGADWEVPVNLGPQINTSGFEMSPWLTPDGLELYFVSDRPGALGGDDIWVSRRASTNDSWQTPENLGQIVNSTGIDCYPCLSPDGLVLFFSDWDSDSGPYRPGGLGKSDMWMTRRKSTMAPWATPVSLGAGMNTEYQDSQPRVSADGSVLYFNSTRPGGPGNDYNVWQAPIIPIVDFNRDGNVDTGDMAIMIDHWDEDYSLCDIGPMPWGDGVVDVEDLKVLAEHMGGYQRPIAHWALDEEEGNIAHDKIGENDASVYGDAVWFPGEGMFGGALLLDGADDWAFTGPVTQFNSGPFSIIAWAKGWIPGRVIISQAMTSNWLATDTGGSLMSEITCVGTTDGPLVSETIITDGNWHRIALALDGSRRTLYVDGIAVAEDIQSGLEISDTGLNIGVGKDYLPETHWSGMIDDIRIYNVALSADQIAALAQ